ncbi:MAG: DUF92 domain-containing protein [Clostridia bacterium]|nr:DUF92 domain-containing protein [Clostridia bacterium]
MIFWGYIGALSYGIACLFLSLLAYKLGIPKKYTRKLVHILVGFEWVILYHLMGVGLHFVAVCVIFTALLAIAYKKNLMMMISSDSDNAPGTVYYGVSMTVMAIISMLLDGFVFAFGIAVFCTSIGDGLAGVIGASVKKRNPKIYENKTLFGTLAAFVFSLVSTLVFSEIYDISLGFFNILAIALFATGLELITKFGLDNISLPLGTAALSYALMNFESTVEYIVPIVLTPFIVAVVAKKGILTKRGILAALLLDLTVTVALGNFGFVLLFAFLFLSVLIDKVKKRFGKADEITKKSGARDGIQVLANGVIPLVMALLYLITGKFAFVIGYNAALAEAFADTAASGVGMLSKSSFDPIRMKKVPVGLSGGMSIAGTLASLIAPLLILLIPLGFGVLSLSELLLCALAAFFGALLDSILGSLFQVKYKCKVCSRITEKSEHCGEQTEKISGASFVTNDVVNVTSATFAAVLAIIVV